MDKLYNSLTLAQREAERHAKSNPNTYVCVISRANDCYHVTTPIDAWEKIMFDAEQKWRLVYYCRNIVSGEYELFLDEKASKRKPNILNDCLRIEVITDITDKEKVGANNLKFSRFEGSWTPAAAPAISPEQIMEIIRIQVKKGNLKELLEPIPLDNEDVFSKASSVQSRSYFAAYMLENGLTEVSFCKKTSDILGNDIVNDTTLPEYDIVKSIENDRITLTLVKNEDRARWRLKIPEISKVNKQDI